MKQKKNNKIFKIGLTGSIGMGKTTVAQIFNDAGIPVSNADDDVANSMAVNGEAVKDISKIFPSTLKYDEKKHPYIDRQELAKLVFADINDLSKLDKLEEILHPIAEKSRQKFTEEMITAGHDIILYDIPLLFENNIDKEVDLTICVSCPDDIQKKRVLARPNMTEEKLTAILQRQMPDSEKRTKADIVIDTSTSLADTKKQVLSVIKQIKSGKIKPRL